MQTQRNTESILLAVNSFGGSAGLLAACGGLKVPAEKGGERGL